ncbi:myotubularin-related family protein [Nannochloropsis gaditana]|uniref:Myotubularin-related family protein n=1 Tax=Nannochloropsis gaditana TaxID=72520 RepID=W7TAV7_9STRA|nr:myotubularin-related family protein [Nannochloropsis gaditana]
MQVSNHFHPLTGSSPSCSPSFSPSNSRPPKRSFLCVSSISWWSWAWTRRRCRGRTGGRAGQRGVKGQVVGRLRLRRFPNPSCLLPLQAMLTHVPSSSSASSSQPVFSFTSSFAASPSPQKSRSLTQLPSLPPSLASPSTGILPNDSQASLTSLSSPSSTTRSLAALPSFQPSSPCPSLPLTSPTSFPPSLPPSLAPDETHMACKVLDAYPTASHYAQGEGKEAVKVPDHVAQFVYPDGFSLRAEEAPPSFFSFVLTDMDGTRTYGCVLHLCEEVSTLPHPAKTQTALGRAFQEAGLPLPSWVQSGNFFVPKALVILSHYPFFNTFREVGPQASRRDLSFLFLIPAFIPPSALPSIPFSLRSSLSSTASPSPLLPSPSSATSPIFSAKCPCPPR